MTQKVDIKELRQSAKLPVKQAGGSTVANFFNHNKDTIKAVLPAHVTPDRMLKIALGAIRTTPKLQEATSESLFGAVVACAQLGLEPNTPAGHAYLIPFRNNKQNRTDVQVIIGYRGLIDLARRSGQIVSISAHEVYSNDEFSYEYGLEEHCKHIPAEGDRGEITHFYAVAKLVGGGYAFEVMTANAVNKIRDNSQNWKMAVRYNNTAKSIWTLHYAEMGRKTTIRRLYKYLPTSIEMMKASTLDAQASTGEAQNLDEALSADYTVEISAGNYEDQATSEAPDEIINEETGEVFDPEIHISPDRVNTDGSYTKRPVRKSKHQKEEKQEVEQTDPLSEYTDAMDNAGNMDELQEAYELTNGPGVKFSQDDRKAFVACYQRNEQRLSGDFQDME